MAGERNLFHPQLGIDEEAPRIVRNRLVESATVFAHRVTDRLPRIGIKPSPEKQREQYVVKYDLLASHGLTSQEIDTVFDRTPKLTPHKKRNA